ncbi:phosphate signaling complex protein PhoU [Terasakiella pusilla]|jgi:phosphate transport system protein|uniref:phosphate signaling complex protein PhoU n=1 Tax=Terasakiella pusilla TaxID=64973 RepID=UPI00048D8228|nr:phosphate signaling complex protein PhoU [Terasakiella pusilla]
MNTVEHTVKSYDSELTQLDNAIARMGGLSESLLGRASEALVKRDTALAADVIHDDLKVDELEMEINSEVTRILALRQPVADDLRAVIAALKTSSDLERIGDLSKNIAKRTITLSNTTPIGAVHTIARMASLVQSMIHNVLDAYLERDERKAIDIRQQDEVVDQLHTSLFRELLTYMMEDPRNITPCTHLLFIAKNVERAGDHATNIAENVHFLVTGKHPKDERPKDDDTSFEGLEE